MIHFVYILKCSDGTYYTGITENFKKRLQEHKQGKSKSTSCRLPIYLKWFCGFTNIYLATKFEKYLKSHSGRRWRDRFLK